VDARERWQALQRQLTLARTALDAGDRASALKAIDSALAIDPNFLAAHSLRERALNEPIVPPPLVSAEGYAHFEQRARRRRVDRRVDAARAALSAGKIKDAAAAIDEISELDPNLPELAALTAEFGALRSAVGTSHSGRWLAAAAAFGAIVLGASWLHDSTGLVSRPLVAISPLVSPPEPLSATVIAADADALEPDTAVATSGADPTMPVERPSYPPSPAPTFVPGYAASNVAATPSVTPASAPPIPIENAASIVPAAVVMPPPPPAAAPAAAAPVSAAVAPAPEPLPPPTPVIKANDEALVQQVLQRYRSAYEGLDARSARAVWPAVNEVALARAFEGLQSQSLTFEACEVQLRGETSAAATCRGSARYVPKIGSREPRVEPRTWNFMLRKSGAGWQIESARAAK
jgi:hypothetical protein